MAERGKHGNRAIQNGIDARDADGYEPPRGTREIRRGMAMNRAMKWVGLLGAWAALTAGPGCMLFDDDYDNYDDRQYGGQYQQETRRPVVQLQPPVEQTQGQAGVYQEKR